ncbi:hypothetical protein ACFO1B_10095 [Dactylosporangium siamense]|uniref:Uncharacterized protein n=1 Tax=Dactylosporangium siamense TaxID=685454 RepID=A0A919UEG8_9ACTN|nr:hypothetical protein [Dactylosporangium siamense]GIG49046.1 hypothetical protein Dsi01nite_070870 [Dactylosporangium siamense]
MPFADDQVRVGLACGRDETGRAWGHVDLSVDAEVLRRLGLHPDQPTSRVTGPSPPAWWHAAAERAPLRSADQPDGPRPRRRPHQN